MPVFINEVSVEVPQPVVTETQSEAAEDRMPVSMPEFTLLQTLTLLEERRQRLQFD